MNTSNQKTHLETPRIPIESIRYNLIQQKQKLQSRQLEFGQLLTIYEEGSSLYRTKPEVLYFIITRFAIGIYDEQWLAYRFYCLKLLPFLPFSLNPTKTLLG